MRNFELEETAVSPAASSRHHFTPIYPYTLKALLVNFTVVYLPWNQLPKATSPPPLNPQHRESPLVQGSTCCSSFACAMDAYSISYNSAARCSSSRIYQDLKTIHLASIKDLAQERLFPKFNMDVSEKVCCLDLQEQHEPL